MADVLTEHPALPTSLYADEPLSNQMGSVGVRSIMLNARGVQLATYWWCASRDRESFRPGTISVSKKKQVAHEDGATEPDAEARKTGGNACAVGRR